MELYESHNPYGVEKALFDSIAMGGNSSLAMGSHICFFV